MVKEEEGGRFPQQLPRLQGNAGRNVSAEPGMLWGGDQVLRSREVTPRDVGPPGCPHITHRVTQTPTLTPAPGQEPAQPKPSTETPGTNIPLVLP